MAAALDLLARTLSLSLDSFLAGVVIGPLVRSGRVQVMWIVLFGVSDGMATLLGVVVPDRLPEPPAAAVYSFAVLLLAWSVRRATSWMFAIPFLFSIDNLATGATIADAPVLALSSAAMSAAGLNLGAIGRMLAGSRFVTKVVVCGALPRLPAARTARTTV